MISLEPLEHRCITFSGKIREVCFVLISKIYRQMYADTVIATDSARISRSTRWARWLAKPCQRLFAAPPMSDLKVPDEWTAPRDSGATPENWAGGSLPDPNAATQAIII